MDNDYEKYRVGGPVANKARLEMNRSAWFVSLALALAFFIQIAGGVLDHSLWTPDEPRVAEIAREMAVSGDYLIPHLSQKPFLEHPSLYYALVALTYSVFGAGNEGVGRIVSVMFALGTLLVVFFATKSLYSDRTAALSVLIVATSFRFFEIAHKIIVDNALCFFITVAMFSFILAHKNIFKHGYKLFWVSIALAFLTKGFVGIAIPAVGVFIFIVWQKDFAIIKKTWVIPGVFLVLCVMSAWGWVLYTKGGADFLSTFFLYNQFGRFSAGNIYHGGHIKPFYYYVYSLWGDAAPWSLLLIPAFIRMRLKDIEDKSRYMISWLVGGFLLLSIASTKRGSYLLPMYPAMAVLITQWMTLVMQKGSLTWEKAFLWIIMALVLVASLIIPTTYLFLLKGSWWTAAVMIVITSGIIVYAWKSYKHTMPLAVVLSWAILLLAWVPFLYPQIDQVKSYKGFYQEVGRAVSNKTLIGYHLNETAEALCPFYGGIYADNIEDKNLFTKIVQGGGAEYAILSSRRLDPDLKALLDSRGGPVIIDKSWGSEKMELWRFSKRK
jgi:4-amino-4-deoxy-L-arabinose transferase-like glycosyltransferase